MHTMHTITACAAACLTCLTVVLPPAHGAAKPSVVVSFSHTSPDTAYARRHAAWLERRPFDGVALEIDPRDADWLDASDFTKRVAGARGSGLDYLADMYEAPRSAGSLRWAGGAGLAGDARSCPWNPGSRYTQATIARALEDLKATKFERFRWNLIIAMIMGPTTDWFNDEQWAQRCRNFAMLARLAREGGCAGILFDDEQYGEGCAWDYEELRRRDAVRGESFDALRDVARRRGRQFARAICAEHSNLVFWTLNGYSSLAWRLDRGQPQFARNLKPAFFDGMLEGASEGMIFIDGGETSYGYTTRKQFEYGRWLCREAPIKFKLTSVPDLYRQKVRCGFGLWPDFYGDLNPDDPQNSFFSPGRLQRALHWALKVGDGYVWLYGGRWTWWVEGPDDRAPVKMNEKRGFPLAYWHAVSAARCSPGSDTSMVEETRRSYRQVSNLTGEPFRGRIRCVDGDALAPLLSRTRKVFEFGADVWTFKLDDRLPFIEGRLAYDAKDFKPILLNAPWKQQGFDRPDTTGWYLLDFRVPPELRERDLYLHFPAVRGSLWLIVNGWETSWRYVEYDPDAWGEPFALQNVPQHILEDGKMTIVLKVQAHDGVAGILEPVELRASKPVD